MTMAPEAATRTETIFRSYLSKVERRTDQMFLWLLLAQWISAVAIALVWSPRTWIAQYWDIHQHVIAAAVLGGLCAAYPIYLILRKPGTRYTRHMIAVGQMLQSALLVHVTGGRIETHFHVFGSLALLAFYRDWPVLITAGIVVYLDHLALGAWFPLSVYGVPAASVWRSLEHAWWALFETVFLAMSCRQGIRELRRIAERETELERANQDLEGRIRERTEQLRKAMEGLEALVEERTKELVATTQGLEVQVAQRTADLQRANATLQTKLQELELLNSMMMGREERILELKQEINDLLHELNRPPKFGSIGVS